MAAIDEAFFFMLMAILRCRQSFNIVIYRGFNFYLSCINTFNGIWNIKIHVFMVSGQVVYTLVTP